MVQPSGIAAALLKLRSKMVCLVSLSKLMRCCYHCMLGKWDLPAIMDRVKDETVI